MGNSSGSKKTISSYYKIKFTAGELIQVFGELNQIFLWLKNHNGEVNCCLIPGPKIIGMYMGVWQDEWRNQDGDWHEILFEEKILLVNVSQMCKVNE
jgi:hypothetical protein